MLSPEQLRAIEEITIGRSIVEAAFLVDRDRRTLSRWMHDEEFASAVQKAIEEQTRVSRKEWLSLDAMATEAIRKGLSSTEISDKLKSAIVYFNRNDRNKALILAKDQNEIMRSSSFLHTDGSLNVDGLRDLLTTAKSDNQRRERLVSPESQQIPTEAVVRSEREPIPKTDFSVKHAEAEKIEKAEADKAQIIQKEIDRKEAEKCKEAPVIM